MVKKLPLKFVEGEGFGNFMNVACPRFKIQSKWTVSRDILDLHSEERQKLKVF